MDFLFSVFRLRICGDKRLLSLAFRPAAEHLVVSVTPLRFGAVYHFVVEQVVMPGAFPNLRMHNNRAVQTNHLKFGRRAGHENHLVVRLNHVVPPRFLDVALDFDAQGAVVPKSVQTAVDFARLEQDSAAFAKRYQIFHFIGIEVRFC